MQQTFHKQVIQQTQSVKLNLVTMTVVRVGTIVLVESIVFNLLFLCPYQPWPEPKNFLVSHLKIHFLVELKYLSLKHLAQKHYSQPTQKFAQKLFTQSNSVKLFPLHVKPEKTGKGDLKSQIKKEIALVEKQIKAFCFDEWTYFQYSPLLERYKNNDIQGGVMLVNDRE